MLDSDTARDILVGKVPGEEIKVTPFPTPDR